MPPPAAGAPGARSPGVLPRVAAGVMTAMVLLLWADVLLRGRLPSALGTSGYGGTAGLVISAVALPIVVGLWLRHGWAWWAGLVAAAWQLMSHLLYIVVRLASGETVAPAGWLIALLLAVFLAVLLLPATRKGCLERDSGA